MYKYKPLIPRSILDDYFNPLVFWYQWNYLRSPAKNLLFFAGYLADWPYIELVNGGHHEFS